MFSSHFLAYHYRLELGGRIAPGSVTFYLLYWRYNALSLAEVVHALFRQLTLRLFFLGHFLFCSLDLPFPLHHQRSYSLLGRGISIRLLLLIVTWAFLCLTLRLPGRVSSIWLPVNSSSSFCNFSSHLGRLEALEAVGSF